MLFIGVSYKQIRYSLIVKLQKRKEEKMPKFRLKLCEIDFQMEISGWCLPTYDDDEDNPEIDRDLWCTVNLSLESSYLHYNPISEMLLSSEVIYLRDYLKQLLDGSLNEYKNVDFAEPDLTFLLRPAKRYYSIPGVRYYKGGYRDYDIDMILTVSFWYRRAVLSSNEFRMFFDRDEINAFYCYLCLITNQLNKDSDEIRQLIKSGQIRLE